MQVPPPRACHHVQRPVEVPRALSSGCVNHISLPGLLAFAHSCELDVQFGIVNQNAGGERKFEDFEFGAGFSEFSPTSEGALTPIHEP
eukprot:scaffold388_cov244-Pinguiococcus_pyrenoidosus.AAC.42